MYITMYISLSRMCKCKTDLKMYKDTLDNPHNLLMDERERVL